MLFVEPTFLFVFLPLLLAGYAICPRAQRNLLLLAASLLFYGLGEKEYAVIMLVSIGCNYAFGLALDRPSSSVGGRWLVVACAVVVNLGLLAFFKYASFLVDLVNPLLAAMGMAPWSVGAIRLPIGISFFTFQGLSYVLDVASGRGRAQRSLVDLGLFISLFPQLIAGPIVRYEQLADQLASRRFNSLLFSEGVRRFAIGAGKKMLLANPMAAVADAIFGLSTEELTAPIAWVGAAAYTLQIYFDFSGYSDMAIGLGRMFGFRIPRNFNYPYIAKSITEFWRRWHISLSEWFRDYLYVPLGGNRYGTLATYRNLLIVFFLCGLWHGANWAFVVWGAYHGGFLVLERAGGWRLLQRLPVLLNHAYCMLATVVGWTLFRSATGPIPTDSPLEYFSDYFRAMFGWTDGGPSYRTASEFVTPFALGTFVAGLAATTPIAIWTVRWASRRRRRGATSCTIVDVAAIAWRLALLAAVVVMVSADTYNPFIYFQF